MFGIQNIRIYNIKVGKLFQLANKMKKFPFSRNSCLEELLQNQLTNKFHEKLHRERNFFLFLYHFDIIKGFLSFFDTLHQFIQSPLV